MFGGYDIPARNRRENVTGRVAVPPAFLLRNIAFWELLYMVLIHPTTKLLALLLCLPYMSTWCFVLYK